MKRINLFVIFLLLFFIAFFPIVNLKTASANVVNAETRTVKIGFFDVPPHIYLDDKTGQIKGAFYELMVNYIAPKMNVKFVWDSKPSAVPRLLDLLQNEKDYAVACLAYTPERAQKYVYPEVSYVSGKSCLALLKSNKLDKVTKVEDIADLTIGYGNAAISPFMKNDKIKFDIVGTPDFNEVNFKKMMAKRIDAVYAPDKASLLYLLKQMNLEQECKILELPEKPVVYNMALGQSLKDVAESYNKAFKELNGAQLYLKLLGKYIDTSKL